MLIFVVSFLIPSAHVFPGVTSQINYLHDNLCMKCSGTFCKSGGKGILGWRNSMCRMLRGQRSLFVQQGRVDHLLK